MVLCKDFISNETYQFIFDDDEFDKLDAVWNIKNDELINLSNNGLFTGRDTYSSLLPVHFQLLISSHIQKLSKEKENRENLLFNDEENFHQKLKLYLMGYIRSIIAVTTAFVDMLTIELLSDHKVNFICHIGICIESTNLNQAKTSKPLKIIVDNTKK